MPITYTNRKGHVYFLCKGITKTGKPRYYFAREPKGEAVEQTPEGYRIYESVNGIVSLVKDRPQLIPPEDVAAVEAALKRLPKARNYRVSVKQDQIIIYEGRGGDIENLSAIFGAAFPQMGGFKDRLQTEMDRYNQFTPVMRFTLSDPDERTYVAERWCYRGSVDDWIYAGHSGKIEQLARKLTPKLGADDFYKLY